MSNSPLTAIVDDDPAMRDALHDLLQVEGLPARRFDSAAAFIADEGTDGFECIITDVRMPGLDGLELQARLRARGCRVPIIFITSVADDALRVRALQVGALAWFMKPVDDRALLRTVRAALACAGGESSVR